MEAVLASGLIAPQSSAAALPPPLCRAVFIFEQTSVDSGAPSAASAAASASAASTAALPSSAEAEEVQWRDASLDQSVSFGVQWGPVSDPLAGLSLSAVWPFFPPSTWTESGEYSDLDPLHAPEWRLRLHWLEDGDGVGDSAAFDPAQAPYVAALHALLEVEARGRELQSLSDVVGAEAAAPAGPHLSAGRADGAALRAASASPPPTRHSASSASSPSSASRATPPSSSALSAFRAVHSSLAAHIESAHLAALYGEVPSSEYIDAVMKQLLDIDDEEAVKKSPAAQTTAGEQSMDDSPPSSSLEPSRALCPYGSLLSLLVGHLCRLHARGQLNVRSVAVFWTEFVNECRYHFEAGLDLPHVQAGDLPDYRSCILHQKLQTLQRCIALQRQRTDFERRKAEGWEGDAPVSAAPAAAFPEADDATASDGLADGWQEFDELKADSPMDVGDDGEQKDAAGADGDLPDDGDDLLDAPEDAAPAPPRGVLHQLRDERLLLSAAAVHSPALSLSIPFRRLLTRAR